jgi:amino acid adenylation domain-containing protein
MNASNDLKNVILNVWNNTNTSYSDHKTMHQLFEERVIEQPDHIALISTEKSLTYSIVNDKANQVARQLSLYGIKPDSFIGILLPRSPELIISLYAILKNGAAYVPLNVSDPIERIVKICQTANIEYILTTNEFRDVLNDGGRNVIVLDDLFAQSQVLNNENINNTVNPDTPAYIIFTSGTTGTPKGVLVKHKPVINLIEWVNSTFKVNNTDTLLWTTNLSFDLSVYDIFGVLAAGGTIRILNDRERMDAQRQLQIMLEEHITFWDSAPQCIQRIIPFLPDYKDKQSNSSLRLVFLSGDWIPLSLPDEIRSFFSKAQVVGLGGATEATIWSNYFIIDKIDPEWKSIPYGKPIQNAKYYILDSNLEHCGIQIPGDLYIGGKCLASEYYNDKELTQKKFINDPFNHGGKLYFTGDKAQWMSDGNIEFLGREDLQVKIHGYRVELGEIKQAVLSVPNIKDCIVVPDKTDLQNIKMFLFYIGIDHIVTAKEDIEKEISKILPDYMIPNGYFKIDCFPISSNGKIDNKALLSIARTSRQQSTADLENKNLEGIYKLLFDMWSDLLGHSDFSINDRYNFIGGDSLFVYSVINKLEELESYSISFKDLDAHPTIQSLGDYLLSQSKSATSEQIVHKSRTTNINLSSHQERIWLNTIINPDAISYNLSFVYNLSGKLDVAIFTKSLKTVFERHSIFFSVLKDIDQKPYLDIIPHEVQLQYLDLSTSSQVELDQYINTNARKKINLYKDRLYSLFLFKKGEGDYIFQLNVHHLIFDGLSLQVFINDLGFIYNTLIRNSDEQLSSIALTQADFSEWERVTFNEDLQNAQLNYWKEQLKGIIPVLNFPYDMQRPSVLSGFGNRISYKVNETLSKKIIALSKKNNCTLFTTMLSFYSILIHKYTSDNDFCIGVPVSYRPDSILDTIIGMFVNTLVLRFSFNDDLTIDQLLQHTKKNTIDALSNQEIPFEKIVKAVNPERINNINPLFQVSFAWQENMDASFGFDDIKSSRLAINGGVSPFDISLYMWENNGSIEGEFEYNTDILTSETIIRLKNNFLHLMQSLVENPVISIASSEMISEQEKKKIEAFTETKVDYPGEKTIVQFFEEQVTQYPEKTAVVFKEKSLTYRQLNEKANQLARTLRESGVERNSSVGILVDKSIEMVIGILGILKAGGAYLAIDPVFPEHRINFMVKDGGCTILLTQSHLMNLMIDGVTKLDLNSESSYHANKSNVERVNNSDDLAYIIYTSGSTGNPKGSLIRHFSVIRTVINPDYMELSSDDRILYTSAIVFDVTTFELWGSLLNGGTIYIIEKETILNTSDLGKELKENNITILHLTSALFTQIAEIRTDIFSGLKYLMVGGDALSAPHINKVRKNNPALKVLNCYGPSENTTFSTIYLIENDFEYNVPIGKPINNSTAYVFDKHLNYQPIGVIGELYVGGEGLSREYLHRDDLNRTSFIENPYKSGERLYKTGDLVRWLSDGNLEFHGRIDNQIKIRGFRVELGEIESVISELNGIIETVIKPIKVQEGNYKLVAFINVEENYNGEAKDVERAIKVKLPPYMVPSAYKFMHGFPKSINGKIDRKALIFDPGEFEHREMHKTELMTKTEKVIHNIWSETLKTGNISVMDNFFDIGGNSILTISLASKLEKIFNIEFNIRYFFGSPRIKDLAELIDIKVNSKKLVTNQKNASIRITSGEI